MKSPKIILIFLLLSPLLWLAPLLGDLGQIHYAPGAQYSDLAITHGPNAEFLRQSLRDYGEIPLWNPHILGGTPFAGDPLSGLYYPPLWLAVLLPAPLAFNLLFLLHLAFAGLGAYLLAREEGASAAGALLAGIAFGGMPKLAAHVSAGHLTLVLAVSWTPWLLLAARRAAKGGGIRLWALAGALAGIIFLADPRWEIPAWLAAITYAIFSARDRKPGESWLRRLLPAVGALLIFALFAAGISAVLAVPLAEFVSLSSRAQLQSGEALALSLPPFQLLNLLFSGVGGSIEWVIYPGAVVLVLALASLPHLAGERGGLPPKVETRRASGATINFGGEGDWFWLILFIVSVVLSLGSYLPGYSNLLGVIPAPSLLRIPPRWMFLAGLALAMMASRGMTALEGSLRGKALPARVFFGLAVAGAVLAGAALWMRLPSPLWIGGAVWCLTGILVFLTISGRMPGSIASVGLILLACFDLAAADIRMIDPHSADPVSTDAQKAADRFAMEGGGYRVYSPSYSIPQLAAVRSELRMLDGIDPLMLQSTVDVVSRAARVASEGYSVTLPAFASANPSVDNSNVFPDLPLLGLLNVRYIASAFEIPSAMLTIGEKEGSIYIYGNMFAMPRAWIANEIETWDRPVRGARMESDGPNRLRIRAAGPGILVLSEASYPSWRASVDGVAAEIQTAGGWWRAVAIGPGEHEVDMWMEPVASWIGLAATMLALIALAAVWRWAK